MARTAALVTASRQPPRPAALLQQPTEPQTLLQQPPDPLGATGTGQHGWLAGAQFEGFDVLVQPGHLVIEHGVAAAPQPGAIELQVALQQGLPPLRVRGLDPGAVVQPLHDQAQITHGR